METIAFLGLGAMGTRMAGHLLTAGHTLRVFNRNPSPMRDLVAAGAVGCASAKSAATGAQFIISMLTDDEAAREVWLNAESGALAGAGPGAILIESSTVTPDWIASLSARAKEKGCEVVDAPVAGTLPQAEQQSLIYFIGGSEDGVRAALPIINIMGSKIYQVGASGKGARFKLAVNGFFATQVASLAELLAYLQTGGVEPTAAMAVLGELPITSPAARGVGGLMASATHPPMFPVRLVAKDLIYAAQGAGASASVLAAVRDAFVLANESALAQANISAVAQLHLK